MDNLEKQKYKIIQDLRTSLKLILMMMKKSKIFKKSLEKHLKVCNTYLQNKQIKESKWYKENINIRNMNINYGMKY